MTCAPCGFCGFKLIYKPVETSPEKVPLEEDVPEQVLSPEEYHVTDNENMNLSGTFGFYPKHFFNMLGFYRMKCYDIFIVICKKDLFWFFMCVYGCVYTN